MESGEDYTTESDAMIACDLWSHQEAIGRLEPKQHHSQTQDIPKYSRANNLKCIY